MSQAKALPTEPQPHPNWSLLCAKSFITYLTWGILEWKRLVRRRMWLAGSQVKKSWHQPIAKKTISRKRSFFEKMKKRKIGSPCFFCSEFWRSRTGSGSGCPNCSGKLGELSCNKETVSLGAAQHRGGILASHPAALGSIPSIPQKISLEFFNVAGIYWRRCLE